MKLPLEQELGIDIGSYPNLSLDKKRLWERIPEALEKMNLAAKLEYAKWGSNYEVYGIKDDWTVDELMRARDYQEKIDETFQPTWVKDRHYYSMQKRYNEKKQLSAESESWPKHLRKFDRLRPSGSNIGIVCGDGKWQSRCTWKKGKYLQAEFSRPVRLVAIGTKGERSGLGDLGRAYVKQYRIQYKNGGDYIGIPKKFQANKDTDTEVTNNIEDPSTGKVGLEVTGIRIIPVDNPKHGYYLFPAMRVALYGEYLEEEAAEEGVSQPGDGGLRHDKFEGTVVTLERHSKKKKEFPRKTKTLYWWSGAAEARWTKPKTQKEHQDAMIVASGGYNIIKGVADFAI